MPDFTIRIESETAEAFVMEYLLELQRGLRKEVIAHAKDAKKSHCFDNMDDALKVFNAVRTILIYYGRGL